MAARETCEIVGWHQDFTHCSLPDWASSRVLYLTAHGHFDVHKYLLLHAASQCTNEEGDIFYDQEISLCNFSCKIPVEKERGMTPTDASWEHPPCPQAQTVQVPPAGDRAQGEQSVLTCSSDSPWLAKMWSFLIQVSMANSLKPSVLVCLKEFLHYSCTGQCSVISNQGTNHGTVKVKDRLCPKELHVRNGQDWVFTCAGRVR